MVLFRVVTESDIVNALAGSDPIDTEPQVEAMRTILDGLHSKVTNKTGVCLPYRYQTFIYS
jgi:hypothetical protein